MPQPSTFPVWDRVTEGALSRVIREMREQGASWATIRLELNKRWSITQSEDGIKRWYDTFIVPEISTRVSDTSEPSPSTPRPAS